MSSSTNFPLRWESTGDQWWFASPIDWATANGHYDLVRELLRLDGNHLIKLTSLRRIRRLETVWDDESQFDEVAKCRSQVARKLFVECENKKGKDSLIRGGCGGWLLYTAASAGDLSFVQELLQRDPLLVFGEGEYGVTDMLYAAARSKNSDVFRLVFEYALSPRFSSGNGEEVEEHVGDVPLTYKVDIMNRALHAAARGGNLGVLKEILAGSSDHVLAYRDIQGATILHAAAGRGQVEVVKYLITCYSDIIISSTDNHGNTALHVAATRGQLAVVEALTDASPSLVYSMNNAGDTFLHVAVTGFQTHCFRRLDRQIELMKELVSGKMCNIEQIVNAKNKDGRTVLHVAIVSNIHSELVELLLMTVGSVDVNIRDKDGMTPLDILRQHPRSESSDIITRKLISAGGMFSHKENENDAAAAEARRVVASHLRMEGSPGTCFRISDPEVLMFTGIEKVGPRNMNKPAANHATQVLKRILQWPRMKKRDTRKLKKTTAGGQSCVDVSPIPLRQRFAKPCSGRSTQHLLPSPTAKKRFGSGLIPNLRAPRRGRSSCSNSPLKSCSGDPPEGCVNRKSSVNQYFCFGAAGGGAGLHPFEIYERSVLSTA